MRTSKAEHHALFVLQRRDLSAADEGRTGACRPVGACYVRRRPQIRRRAAQPHGCNAEAAKTDATDAETIGFAPECQRALAATRADDKSSLENAETNRAR